MNSFICLMSRDVDSTVQVSKSGATTVPFCKASNMGSRKLLLSSILVEARDISIRTFTSLRWISAETKATVQLIVIEL